MASFFGQGAWVGYVQPGLGSCGAERHGRVLATARHGGAAARTPVTSVLASRARHGLSYLAQKDGEVALMLTKGLGWRGLQCRTAGGDIRRRSVAERADGSKGGVSGLLGSSVRLQECL